MYELVRLILRDRENHSDSVYLYDRLHTGFREEPFSAAGEQRQPVPRGKREPFYIPKISIA